jgi:hypothetical protein
MSSRTSPLIRHRLRADIPHRSPWPWLPRARILASIGETEAQYQAWLRAHISLSKPWDAEEFALVETMVCCLWKRKRAWNLECTAWQIAGEFATVRPLGAASIAGTHATNLLNKAEDVLYRLQTAEMTSKPNFEQPAVKSSDCKDNLRNFNHPKPTPLRPVTVFGNLRYVTLAPHCYT